MIEPNIFQNFTPEESISFFRDFLFCEARFNRLPPSDITISSRLFVADQGIDASINTQLELKSESCLSNGQSGFQIKTGTSFTPWQPSQIQNELLNSHNEIENAIAETLNNDGQYILVCFGHDFTSDQRNQSILNIIELLEVHGHENLENRVDVWGQTQLLGYVNRYPSLQVLLSGGITNDFLTIKQWSRHEHMSNEFVASESQEIFITSIHQSLFSDTKHIRIIGEPGIGKTRMVLEAVRDENIAANTLYVTHGANFEQTDLFLNILKDEFSYPLVLILDELSEKNLSGLWGHLKNRYGDLKIISIDHGPEYQRDSEIQVIQAPALEDSAIKNILITHTGERDGLDRWVDICEGSPRVAQAVGQNLAANPNDIFLQPTTVPIWDRFIYGYGNADDLDSRQTMLVMRYLSLFVRFGFEEPVSDEAHFICDLINQADSAITWVRFQEIVQRLRDRRILQGRHTLFIVPKALHIYLWKEFWKLHGRGFDFIETYTAMPETLHGWFSNMFKYAYGTNADSVVKSILKTDGIFSNHDFLVSDKGSSLISTLAEANPEATVMLLEHVLSEFTSQELLEFKTNRQSIVFALEKIAVWKETFQQAARLLALLSLHENSDYSNNATGTFKGLFSIGPEWAATETSPKERLPILQLLLDDANTEYRNLGLDAISTALKSRGGYRIIGAENQGLRERANLWKPETYDDWRREYERYLDFFVGITRDWDNEDRKIANKNIINAVGDLLKIPPLIDKLVGILEMLTNDEVTYPWDFYHLVINFERFKSEEDNSLLFQLKKLEAKLCRSNIKTRFDRYVLCDSWDEWEAINDENSRQRKIVRFLAQRIARNQDLFDEILPLAMEPKGNAQALFLFGQDLSRADNDRKYLQPLLENTEKDTRLAGGYLDGLKRGDPKLWQSTLDTLLSSEQAELAGKLIWHTGFNDKLFESWLEAFEQGRLSVRHFSRLHYGRLWEDVSTKHIDHLLQLLNDSDEIEAGEIIITLLDDLARDSDYTFNDELVFSSVCKDVHFKNMKNTMHGHHWKNVCEKLVERCPKQIGPLLKLILEKMNADYSLSYNHDVEPLAHHLCELDPIITWKITSEQLLSLYPKWRGDLISWLKGGLGKFDTNAHNAAISLFPLQSVLEWIEEDIDFRASLIAHCVPGTLEKSHGGLLPASLIERYSHEDGVLSGISCNFHSGSWSGPTSVHYRNIRDRFYRWLTEYTDPNLIQWIEGEIRCLDQRIQNEEINEERESWRH